MKEFEASLQSLRGLNVDISQEAAEIKDYTNFLQQISGDAIMNLFQRKYIHSLIVGVGLIVFQRFGGVYVFLFYAGTIFESAGFSSRIGSITAAIVQIITTTLGAVLVDVSGRRLMLLISTVGACLGCIITALAFVFEVYLGFLQLGVGGIPWIIMSEAQLEALRFLLVGLDPGLCPTLSTLYLTGAQ
ncbi:Sugar transporter ERD6-like 5 [Citrus sinensis]|uniref:Sugar transporter ERD6-like 5 n=1 Tax=Citrus sinensis TaxID=2711 RepID=A0ACB8KK37_CITSI|nr:Sugar transporter ERD6-like 5 [Citrus sinensis]